MFPRLKKKFMDYRDPFTVLQVPQLLESYNIKSYKLEAFHKIQLVLNDVYTKLHL